MTSALGAARVRPCTALAPILILATAAHAADVSVTLSPGSGFSVKDNTGAIERLRVDEVTGNVSRNGALFVHTTGSNNTFVGHGAGNLSTSGYGYNTATGSFALSTNTTGSDNTATGAHALRSNTTGSSNTAAGRAALGYNTTGSSNTAAGALALGLNTTGGGNTAAGTFALKSNTAGSSNTAAGFNALQSNTTGNSNTATGSFALSGNTTGSSNTATGRGALSSNTTGESNTAAGFAALQLNTAGYGNSAFGGNALASNTTGANNSAFGRTALVSADAAFNNAAFGEDALLFDTTGSSNSAFGQAALRSNITGARNVAVGASAGGAQTTGSDNIYLSNFGVAGESGQIKIGEVGTHTRAHVAGIHGATSAGGIAVLVNASGTLGTTTSSARFKQGVEDLGDASDLLMQLRPVRFHYRAEEVGAEEAKATQYGLIAEEVAQVAPELVAPDADGRPYSVKYHVLPALLLNELQEQQRTNDDQQRTIEALLARVEELERRSLANAEVAAR